MPQSHAKQTAGDITMNGKFYGMALGLGYLCMAVGLVLIGLTLTANTPLLIPGIAVVVVGLGAITAANGMKPR
jgi:hypothetical protein